MVYKIPFIQRATAAAGGELPLFAQPLEPASLDERQQNMLQGGKLPARFTSSGPIIL